MDAAAAAPGLPEHSRQPLAALAGRGAVESLTLLTAGGFDTGSVRVGDLELTIWNEYMTLERSGRRLATFPDLIVTLDDRTGLPVASAELREGASVAVAVVPRSALRLAPAALDAANLAVIERALGKTIVRPVRNPC
jgi:DUF917 family protein